ncbi:hypothetical protein OIU84_029121 [Salix udensis]|uniref:Uncharacterized protein n=1 Tax=Salix udensis TaxID=889485 RepID=A0AAD6KAZ0_9ROSI|nr:hypothetical protein OIU84_029121 [Salix udensis]
MYGQSGTCIFTSHDESSSVLKEEGRALPSYVNCSMIGSSSSPSSDPGLVYTVVAYVGDDETFSKNIARASHDEFPPSLTPCDAWSGRDPDGWSAWCRECRRYRLKFILPLIYLKEASGN